MANVQFLESIRPISNSANANIPPQICTTESVPAPLKGLPAGMQLLHNRTGKICYNVMRAGLVTSMHDIHIACLDAGDNLILTTYTTYRFVPLSRRNRFDRKKRVWFGFTAKHRSVLVLQHMKSVPVTMGFAWMVS
ncbi:hypothetical protein ACN38_g4188 [Penicillium nordicum]|uniref:Uncharacterized protein n=1 Tax=Penicillium nordicum TaxID=229535 RepID=A0A0M9WHF9_9EURO|nr:hypothetical protein ACN38_g4188 [Penicillium nordicum]